MMRAVRMPVWFGARNMARPVSSVDILAPEERSTSTAGTRRPAASTTARVAFSPATKIFGRTIVWGTPVCASGGRAAGVCDDGACAGVGRGPALAGASAPKSKIAEISKRCGTLSIVPLRPDGFTGEENIGNAVPGGRNSSSGGKKDGHGTLRARCLIRTVIKRKRW